MTTVIMKISNFIKFFIMFLLIDNTKSNNLLNLHRLKNHLLNLDPNYKGSNELEIDNIFDQNFAYLIRIDDTNEAYKPIARMKYNVKIRKEQMKKDLAIRQHELRKSVVEDFMENHMLTTKYLYDEVLRIKSTRQVKDDLRIMVEYLERPENALQKEAVLNFFRKNKNIKKVPNVWDQTPNDLVINVIKDPFNYGTIN